MKWFWLILLALLIGVGGFMYYKLRFEYSPEAPPEIVALYPMPEHTSVVGIPISVSVDRVEEALRKKISKLHFELRANIPLGKKRNEKRVEKGKDEREIPLLLMLDFSLVSLKLIPNGQNLTANVVYDIKFLAMLDNDKKTKIADCGYGEERPRIDFTLKTTYALTKEGKVTLGNKRWQLAWDRPCKLTLLNLSVEELLKQPELQEKFEKVIDDVVTNKIPEAINLLPELEKTWKSLERPIRLGPELYLNIQPQSVTLGSLTGDASSLTMDVAALCIPQLTTGMPETKPAVEMSLVDSLRSDDSIRFYLTTSLPIQKLNELLGSKLKKKEFTAGNMDIKITKLRAYQSRNEIVFMIRLTKPFRGDVYITAKPGYDKKTGSLVFEKFDYNVATQEMMGRMAGLVDASLLKSAIEDELNKAADKSLSNALGKFDSFSKDLKNDITISGGLQRIEPIDMLVSDNRIFLISEVTGTLLVQVK